MLDVKHIKQDGKEFKEIKNLADKINKIVGEMQKEDSGVLKTAKIGAGFAALQRIGLGEKALSQYAGSSWLKNEVKQVAKPIVKPVLTREAFLGGAKGSRVNGNTIGSFTTPFSVVKTAALSIQESHKGALHEYLKVPVGEKIPTALLQERLKVETDPKRRKQLNYALVARKWHHKGDAK